MIGLVWFDFASVVVSLLGFVGFGTRNLLGV